jgi:hypothetical protein
MENTTLLVTADIAVCDAAAKRFDEIYHRPVLTWREWLPVMAIFGCLCAACYVISSRLLFFLSLASPHLSDRQCLEALVLFFGVSCAIVFVCVELFFALVAWWFHADYVGQTVRERAEATLLTPDKQWRNEWVTGAMVSFWARDRYLVAWAHVLYDMPRLRSTHAELCATVPPYAALPHDKQVEALCLRVIYLAITQK